MSKNFPLNSKEKVLPSDDTATVVEENEFTSNLTESILLLQKHPDLITNLKTSLEENTLTIKQIPKKITSVVLEYNRQKSSELHIALTPTTKRLTNFLRDAFFIRGYGLETFVASCMGESGHSGWANASTETPVKFKQMPSYAEYLLKWKTFTDLKTVRLGERGQDDILTSKPTLLKDIWKLKINMSGEEKNFSDSLTSFFTKSRNWFSTDNETIFGLLTKFGEYILKNQNIDVIFEETLNILFEEAREIDKDKIQTICQLRNNGSKTFKQLFCFALEHCIKLNPLPPSGGGHTFSRHTTQGPRSDMNYVPPTEEVTLNNRVVPIILNDRDPKKRRPNRSYWKKILVSTFCIMSFIYFTLLLFETYRLLNATITRILDARVTYLALYGPGNESQADKTFIGYINSFLQVMYESAAGNIIETLDSLSPLIMQQLLNSLMTVATTATNEQYSSCADGIFGCVNSFFTGESQRQLEDLTNILAMKEFDTAVLEVRHTLQRRINETKYIWRSGTRNLVTALHGISFSSILMLHILYPKSYNREIVAVSASALITAYNTNPLYGIYALGGQFSLLLYPQIPQINVEEIEEIEDSPLVEQSQASTPQLVIAQPDVPPPVSLRQQFNHLKSIRGALKTLRDKANEELRRDESVSRGGRKRRTLKKRKYKTMKKKIIKNKRTIRR